MKNKKLFIHVGNFKTGTTAIQDYFFNNDVNGIHYIKGLNQSNCHGNLVYSIIRSELGEIIDNKNELINNYIKNINESQDDILLSAEAFMRMKTSHLPMLKEFISKLNVSEIKVILFIRQPKSFVASWYNQMVKELPYNKREMGNVLSYFYRNIDKGFVSNLETFDIFESVAGEGNVIVNKYGVFGMDHLNSFCALLGIDDNPQNEQISNRRIKSSVVELERISKSKGELVFRTDVSISDILRKVRIINSEIDLFNDKSGMEVEYLSLDDLISIYLVNAAPLKEGFVNQDAEYFKSNLNLISSIDSELLQKINVFFKI